MNDAGSPKWGCRTANVVSQSVVTGGLHKSHFFMWGILITSFITLLNASAGKLVLADWPQYAWAAYPAQVTLDLL